MKCPYCGKEMEIGLIQSMHAIEWIKGEKKHLFSIAGFKDESISLSDFDFLTGSAVKANLCRNCHKVIIDYESEEINE